MAQYPHPPGIEDVGITVASGPQTTHNQIHCATPKLYTTRRLVCMAHVLRNAASSGFIQACNVVVRYRRSVGSAREALYATYRDQGAL